MSNEVNVYTSLPVDIHATQWDGTQADAGRILEWMQKHGDHGFRFIETNETRDRENPEIQILTLEGVMTAKVNDWIIQGTRGEFYPCKPDVFQTKYKQKLVDQS